MAGVLLAGLAVALWWSNRQEKAKEGKPAADASPKILALGADTIQRIEIRHRGEDPITLQLKGSQWGDDIAQTVGVGPISGFGDDQRGGQRRRGAGGGSKRNRSQSVRACPGTR